MSKKTDRITNEWCKKRAFRNLTLNVNTKCLHKYPNIPMRALFNANYIIPRAMRRAGTVSCAVVYYSSSVAMPFLGKALICQFRRLKTGPLLSLLFRHLHCFACKAGTLSGQINLLATLSFSLAVLTNLRFFVLIKSFY